MRFRFAAEVIILMTKFVIFANARSGSTSLARLLGESSDVKLCPEPFHPNFSKWKPGRKNYSEIIKDSETMNQALDEIFSKHTATKALIYQFSKSIYLTMLARKELKIVLLCRRNLAQAALSSLIAQQTSIWHKSDIDESVYDQLKPVKIVEIDKMADYFGEMNEFYAKFLKKNRKEDYMSILYEDLYSEDMEQNVQKISKICKFLGISLPPLRAIEKFMKPSKAKQNQNNLYKKVPNYREIEERFNSIFE